MKSQNIRLHQTSNVDYLINNYPQLSCVKNPYLIHFTGIVTQNFDLKNYDNTELYAISGGIITTENKWRRHSMKNSFATFRQDYFIVFMNEGAQFAHHQLKSGQPIRLSGYVDAQELACDYVSEYEFMGEVHKLNKDEFMTMNVITVYAEQLILLETADNLVNLISSEEELSLRCLS